MDRERLTHVCKVVSLIPGQCKVVVLSISLKDGHLSIIAPSLPLYRERKKERRNKSQQRHLWANTSIRAISSVQFHA